MAESATDGGQATGELAVELGGRRLGLDDLAHVNRMTALGLVLPNTAHEINNALQVVGGLLEMLSARSDLPPDVLDKLTRGSQQVARATGLMRELVAFARRERAAPVRADLSRIAEAALAMRRYHLSRDRVAVTTDLAPPAPVLCRVDPHYLQQALVNLLLNAEQALKGQPDPTLRVAVAAAPGGGATVLVEDNGCGLGEAAGHAGEPFYSTLEAQALGLGVAVSRALVERQGGRLDLEPAGPRGTRARITLGA
jgi:two-component system C4-dicarboxylate transport sensor histidine kinase DctB